MWGCQSVQSMTSNLIEVLIFTHTPPTSLLLKLHCVRSYSSLFIHNSFFCILNLNFWSKNIINLSPISLSNSQIIKQPWKLGDQHEIWNSVSQCYSKSKQPKKIRSQKKNKNLYSYMTANAIIMIWNISGQSMNWVVCILQEK